MIVSVERVTVRRMRVMRGLPVVTGFGMLGGLAMMLCGVLVMFRCLLMMLVDFVFAHRRLPDGFRMPQTGPRR